MISLDKALALKEAGLVWNPGPLDFFGLPDRHMDERIFVISDMLVTVDILQGLQVVAFQGASEWALDSLVTTEAVWIPREEQLRKALEAALIQAGRPELLVTSGLAGSQVEFIFRDERLAFSGVDAEQAYAAGLLHVLKAQAGAQPPM